MAKKKEKKTVTKPSPKPTGLGMTRSMNKFTCTWKGEFGEGVEFKKAIKTTGKKAAVTKETAGKKSTSRVISIDASKYYPNVQGKFLEYVAFQVSGKTTGYKTTKSTKDKTIETTHKFSWSGYTSWYRMTMQAPRPPVVTLSRESTYNNTFTIDTPEHVNDRFWWSTHVQYNTCLAINKDYTAGSKIPEAEWGSLHQEIIHNNVTGSDKTSFAIPIIETNITGINTSNNAVRWFRARVVGPSGVSGWVYSNVPYSEPYPAEITSSTVTETNRDACICTVSWNYKDSVSHPIDTIAIRYAFVLPGGIYSEYKKSNDTEIISGKNYYTVEATKVPESDLSIDKVWKYYYASSSVFKRPVRGYYPANPTSETWNEGKGWYIKLSRNRGYIEAYKTPLSHTTMYYVLLYSFDKDNETYYRASLVPRSERREEDADQYYLPNVVYYTVMVEDLMRLWRDNYISKSQYEILKLQTRQREVTSEIVGYTSTGWLGEDHDYFKIEEVEDPVRSEAEHYLVLDTPRVFQKVSSDVIALDKNTNYYTLTATTVPHPIIDDIGEYYEESDVLYLEPVSEFSWEDAEIGGNNTIPVPRSNSGIAVHPDTQSFTINQAIPKDQLLYVSVRTTYNNINIDSKYYRCTNLNGEIPNKDSFLSNPDNPFPTWGDDVLNVVTHNNSEVYGVKIAIVFIPDNASEISRVIGVATPDQEGEVDINVEVPPKYLDPQTSEGFGIGVYAFVGTYTLSNRVEEGSKGYNIYSINPIIRSEMMTYGGEIPRPPSDVQVSHLGNGNVLVTWKCNWKGADSSEVAWSDYSEALDSTTQPSTYEVQTYKDSRLIIRDLELGKIWYFWVRLKKNENASMWTVPKYISLSSSPNVPTLELSKRYISLDEKFVATWTYVSTDNTPQSSASICICSVDGDSVTYGEIIASIPSDEITNPETQSMVLDPKSDKLSWMDGQDYYLAIRVVSGSGMMSDWSQYVPISVISPIDCSITYTSLYPNINEYDSEETYSVGDYVVHRMYDRTNNNIENGKIYKCISEISEAEYWDDSHWAIDQEMTYFELTSLPLEVEVDTGDRNDIRTTIIIERSEDYFVDRPDGGKYGGHAGDIVAQVTVQNNSDGPILIGTDELTDYLDDGAYYYLTVRITDNYGQSHEIRYEFIVNWSHQALMPTAEMDIDDVYNVAKIFVGDPESVYMLSTDTEVVEGTTYYIRTGEGTFEDPFVYEEVLNPTGSPVDNGWYYCADTVEDGDVCDIYRMSADGLELLYPNADFNETYVDPYPTIGERGGYRVVYKTVNGDYITPSMGFAWVDLDDGDILDSMSHIIDFDEGTVRLSYNVDLDNSWSKDFQETHYLGGSVVGDWNPGVSRTGSINANVVTSDWDVISSLRRLANYNGVCHVRTTDGSNYMANIDVSERVPYQTYTNPDTDIVKVYEYSLSLTRVDSIDYDGLTLAEWEERIADET